MVIFTSNQTHKLTSNRRRGLTMNNKKALRRLHITLLLTSIPLGILQWTAIALWIARGIWQLIPVWAVLAIPYGLWISRWYFRKVAYICPQCHRVFKPTLREAFWASHTPATRKLTCPACGHRGFCVETWGGRET